MTTRANAPKLVGARAVVCRSFSLGSDRRTYTAEPHQTQASQAPSAPATLWQAYCTEPQQEPRVRAVMARHEASHAVIARVQGIECNAVVMFSPIEGLAAGTQTVKATEAQFGIDMAAFLAATKRDIIVSLAGPCGEMKYRNKPWHKKYFRRWTSDFQSAQRSARRAAMIATGISVDRVPASGIHHPTAEQIAIANELPLQCLAAASDLVDTHWPSIQHVAQALMTRDMLDQAELDRLIAEASHG